MLKPGIFICSLIFSLLSVAKPVPGISHVEKEVLESFESLVRASKALDSERYLQHIDADKFVGLNSNGTNWNAIEDFSPLITEGFPTVAKIMELEFPNVKVSVIDQQTAVLVNEFVQTMKLKNGNVFTLCGGGTQVWSKQSGGWKLVSISASNKSDNCKK